MCDFSNFVPPAEYSEKIVAFFDILGWREKINRAGSDAQQIGLLKAAVEIFTVFGSGADRAPGDRLMTSFSDNVVCSIPYDPSDISSFIESLARVQFGISCLGFFIRGSITIGQIYHSSLSVFGPALNRAYELESKFAKKSENNTRSEFKSFKRLD